MKYAKEWMDRSKYANISIDCRLWNIKYPISCHTFPMAIVLLLAIFCAVRLYMTLHCRSVNLILTCFFFFCSSLYLFMVVVAAAACDARCGDGGGSSRRHRCHHLRYRFRCHYDCRNGCRRYLCTVWNTSTAFDFKFRLRFLFLFYFCLILGWALTLLEQPYFELCFYLSENL